MPPKIIGVNVRADGLHSVARVAKSGANGVRIVLTEQHDLTGLLRDYRRAGISVLAVYASESQMAGGSHGASMHEYMRRHAAEIDFAELMNEPDLASESSWTMDRRTFVRTGWELHNAVRAWRPDLPIIAGGMASGDPNYVRYLDLDWCNLLGIHPYAKDLTRNNDLPDIDVLLGQYREVTSKPFAVTEWGWWGDEAQGESEVEDVVAWAAVTRDIEHFWYFALGDDMVPPFGLYRENGKPKPAADAFRRAAANRRPDLSAWADRVGPGLLEAMARDGTLPAWDHSLWPEYGECCAATNTDIYTYFKRTNEVVRVPTRAA